MKEVPVVFQRLIIDTNLSHMPVQHTITDEWKTHLHALGSTRAYSDRAPGTMKYLLEWMDEKLRVLLISSIAEVAENEGEPLVPGARSL